MQRDVPASIDSIPIHWPAGPREARLGAEEIHVWALARDCSCARLAELTAVLSNDERGRAARFASQLDRARYSATRGMLRSILGQYTSRAPAELQFALGPHGKPSLANIMDSRSVHFNLSHSGGLALLAVTRAGPVGVDVEHIRSGRDADAIAKRFFSRSESEIIGTAPLPEKDGIFFELWTCKEAWLKATGEGIAAGLEEIEMERGADGAWSVAKIDGDKEEAAAWALWQFSPASEYVGALAIRASGMRLQCWRWAG